MQIATAGLGHEKAPVSVRERFAMDADELRDANYDLARSVGPGVGEAAIVSTCNRTELYLAGPADADLGAELGGWLQRRFKLKSQDLKQYWRTNIDRHAVRHLFRVASGLESMVLGEPQILGQVKGAARSARDAGAMGSHLHKLFEKSFSVAKEVRSTTGVGHGSVSLGAAAVRMTEKIVDSIAGSRVLFIGAGEMIRLTAMHFAARGPAQICIANRNPERARDLAEKIGAECIPLTGLTESFGQFDIVVSCTGSQLPIVGMGTVRDAVDSRRGRPMIIIDLAVPRDVESAVASLSNVFLFTVDDLGNFLNSRKVQRQQAVDQASLIVDQRTDDFMRWLIDRKSVPLICQLHQRVNELKASEVERALRSLRGGSSPEEVVKTMANAISAKFAHGPISMLRGDANQKQAIAQLIEHLVAVRQ